MSTNTLTPRALYEQVDRKSTRLNSSHTVISYAVFCLKTKEHTSELQSQHLISYAVFCLKSKEHTSELQSHSDIVCHLLLEKQKGQMCNPMRTTDQRH